MCLHQQIEPLVAAAEVPGRLRRWLSRRDIRRAPRDVRVETEWWPLWEAHRAGRTTLMLAAPSLWPELEALDLSGGRRSAPTATDRLVAPQIAAAAAQQRTGAETLRLVHVPIHVLTYRMEGRRYAAWMDGVGGAVLAEDTPVADSSGLHRRHLQIVLGTAAVFFVEGCVIEGFGPTLLAFAATGIALNALLRRRAARWVRS